ncbi:MBOAT family protein [Flavobacterium circumlabens]|uniref:D-alanyl-lipoteichoic acid acyltransferase DltB (MBOAT superfamily) n=1 Tax=Flavobacterium circumlabens TaxID=2133765 RepID=A0A4Y7UC44_9FLAO|nr:MBOAT family O-acyltransferase [Flavobacterium circumlabens]TCN56363.1 D-alanyl-lipoteichoic acid acyltransferase DltB (MBOAT superfamily) [Flavobacterium circumlabens]TEB43399.1 MBOAT family protein [Flavobacterium circumlabens]
MLFNSISFAVFLPIIFILYWFVTNKSLKFQNFLLLGASYYFYACWDWRFLFLLVFSTLLDFYSAIAMSNAKNDRIKKFWFWLSISINLGFLGIFKYYNFFAESFSSAISNFGFHINTWTLNIILPVGISFYTFHGLSYVIDCYQNKIKEERNFIDYSLFVSFFPLLVAGPIERATHLLPQIKNQRIFNYENAISGLRQILWGLFKKVVIADQCAQYANMVFNNSENYSGSTLLIGAVFFALQIYGDFSGYSDIALGVARLFGFELLKNFAFPYFSRDIAEFWRRWHISLSTWFRDYLYIPLGGGRGGTWIRIRNTFAIFLVSGFWHGANWTFIVWGGLNALLMMPSIVNHTNRANLEIVAKGSLLPTFKELFQMCSTFLLVVFVWIFFRAESLIHAFQYIGGIFSNTIFSLPAIQIPKRLIFIIFIFIFIEWLGRENEFALQKINLRTPKLLKWGLYYVLIFLILYYAGSDEQFIYFQF